MATEYPQFPRLNALMEAWQDAQPNLVLHRLTVPDSNFQLILPRELPKYQDRKDIGDFGMVAYMGNMTSDNQHIAFVLPDDTTSINLTAIRDRGEAYLNREEWYAITIMQILELEGSIVVEGIPYGRRLSRTDYLLGNFGQELAIPQRTSFLAADVKFDGPPLLRPLRPNDSFRARNLPEDGYEHTFVEDGWRFVHRRSTQSIIRSDQNPQLSPDSLGILSNHLHSVLQHTLFFPLS